MGQWVKKNQYHAWWWTSYARSSSDTIDPSHKSHHASDKYPTMHHFVSEMCTCVHISVTKWCIVGYGTGALWDLWNGSIVTVGQGIIKA